MTPCLQCPRRCGTDRTSAIGFCREGAPIRAAWAGLHFGEEPPITGLGGSGTIFITGCNLRCAFCQNVQISQQGMGAELTKDAFADLCLALQDKGAENINIVTGSHHPAAIAAALSKAKKCGLAIPVCWNGSGYETEESVRLLSEVVDIWLPDLKTLDPDLAQSAFAAPDYPRVATRAIALMAQTTARYATVRGRDGEVTEKMLGGVIVRHLALPGRLDDTRAVLTWFKRNLDGRALLSLMTQYTPMPSDCTPFENRHLTQEEYEELTALLDDREDGFFQELVIDDSWLPDFSRPAPFSSDLAKGVWHWRYGYLTG